MKIILASTSSIRRRLLENAGIPHICKKPDVDERKLTSIHPHWTPETAASELAAAKAIAVSREESASLVIGADQVLSHRGRVFDKPSSLDECRKQLLQLRDSSHQLSSAVSCASQGKLLWTCVSIATLRMRPFTPEFLDAYLLAVGDDYLTTVGGYKLESIGLQMFDTIDGDYFTMLGLPLLPLLGFLRQHGTIPT